MRIEWRKNNWKGCIWRKSRKEGRIIEVGKGHGFKEYYDINKK